MAASINHLSMGGREGSMNLLVCETGELFAACTRGVSNRTENIRILHLHGKKEGKQRAEEKCLLTRANNHAGAIDSE
jgi:hypothetical protein